MKNIEIAVDFDGTVCDHRYPEIGPTAPHCIETLKYFISKGYKLILYTMRDGKKLEDAVNWFKENNIELYGIQWNPGQETWTKSNKCYAQLYIDDSALGVPLVKPDGFVRPCVDWKIIKDVFESYS
jgi:hydroxymethylpyrimidine pyrophosphatase-like HAD family hydrolase